MQLAFTQSTHYQRHKNILLYVARRWLITPWWFLSAFAKWWWVCWPRPRFRLSITAHTIVATHSPRACTATLATIKATNTCIATKATATLPCKWAPDRTQTTVIYIGTHINTTVPATSHLGSWLLPSTTYPWPVPAPWSWRPWISPPPCIGHFFKPRR